MDILTSLIQQLASGAAAQAGISLWKWAAQGVRGWFANRERQDVDKLLHELGATTPSEIKELVTRELQGRAVPAERREELTRLLLQLARGTRLATSQGTASIGRSGHDLIEQVLEYLQPVREAGQPVSRQLNQYVLKRFLGMGTFGEVWLGQHTQQPALKYAFKFFTHEGAGQWLHREQAKLVAAQKAVGGDQNFVRLFHLAVDGEKYPYLMLEYLPGGTLEDWILETAPAERTPLRKDDVIRGVVRALARAHEAGIAHRDLKPANILLTGDPLAQPKIGDFGLADVREQIGAREKTGLRGSIYGTQAAAMVGTPLYWPPEAWVPRANRNSKQDDVFATGVIWYQLLVEHIERPPYDFVERLRDAGQDSQTINLISRCLAGPERRFADAVSLETDMHGTTPPMWPPVPKGCFDVSLLVKECLVGADT